MTAALCNGRLAFLLSDPASQTSDASAHSVSGKRRGCWETGRTHPFLPLPPRPTRSNPPLTFHNPSSLPVPRHLPPLNLRWGRKCFTRLRWNSAGPTNRLANPNSEGIYARGAAAHFVFRPILAQTARLTNTTTDVNADAFVCTSLRVFTLFTRWRWAENNCDLCFNLMRILLICRIQKKPSDLHRDSFLNVHFMDFHKEEARAPNCDPTGKAGHWSKGCIEKFDHSCYGKMSPDETYQDVLNK